MRTNELKILGIKVDNLNKEQVEERIENSVESDSRKKMIVTLNPEIILKGYRDREYGDILNSADLKICDGFGIKSVSWMKGKKVKARYTGVELTEYLLKQAREKNKKVFVAVAKNSLSNPGEIERGIKEKHNLDAKAEYFKEETFFDSEAVSNAEIVFVNFGAPDQERFIFQNREKFPKARILVGVGGTFDFLTGKMKRAPRWMRKLGMEWLFRLFREPKRIRRITNAVLVFPFLALFRSE